MPPSRVGTINPLDTTTRAYVDENLKEVAAGSADAAFIYKRSDLDRIRKRRKELGFSDEAQRVQVASHKVALEDARRRAAAAAEEVVVLEARVDADEKAEKAASKSASKDDAGAKAEKA